MKLFLHLAYQGQSVYTEEDTVEERHLILYLDQMTEICPPELRASTEQDIRGWAYNTVVRNSLLQQEEKPSVLVVMSARSKYILPDTLEDGHAYVDMFLECLKDEYVQVPLEWSAVPRLTYSKQISSFPNLLPTCKIFVVCSIVQIDIKNKGRSVFSTEERLQQTLRQLKSIHSHYPEAYTIVCEMSQHLHCNDQERLQRNANVVLSFADDMEARILANDHPNKNLAEVYVLQHVCSLLLKKNQLFSHVAKFGGRYWFHPSVSVEERFGPRPVMQQIEEKTHYHCTIVEPVFYSIPYAYVGEYCEFLQNMLSVMYTQPHMDNERLLYTFAKKVGADNPASLALQGFTASGIFRSL